MKEIGKIYTQFSTDEENWITVGGGWRMYYREPISLDDVKCVEYKDLEKRDFELHKPGLFNSEEFKYFIYDWEQRFIVKPNEKLYVRYQWFKCDKVSFDQLSSRMDVEDLIEYFKDKGINVCPLK